MTTFLAFTAHKLRTVRTWKVFLLILSTVSRAVGECREVFARQRLHARVEPSPNSE
jgi:hypothetical protein